MDSGGPTRKARLGGGGQVVWRRPERGLSGRVPRAEGTTSGEAGKCDTCTSHFLWLLKETEGCRLVPPLGPQGWQRGPLALGSVALPSRPASYRSRHCRGKRASR